MRTEILMPRMGQNMEEGKVVAWLKPSGAAVKHGEVIAEIETDKAIIDLEAPVDGTLVELAVPEKEIVLVGTLLAVIEDGNATQIEEIATRRPIPVAVPPISEAATRSQTNQAPSINSDSAIGPTSRVRSSPAARFLAAQHNVDLRLVKATQPDRFVTKTDVEAFLAAQQAAILPQQNSISPVARRYAEKHGIDLTRVIGSGPGGRIMRSDIETILADHQQAVVIPGLTGTTISSDVQRVPLSKIRRTTARRMSESKTTIPHFYESIDVELSRAMALRESFKEREIEVSINDLILRATTLALLKFPNLNATFAEEEIHVHPCIHLAVAIALAEGLITPVIPYCESLSLPELAASSHALIDRARNGHLRPEDLEEGTFTVTNLGMYGVKEFQAIVNPPQAAILAVGGMRRVPAFDAFDRIVPAQLISLTISADHRVTDGAEVARFLAEAKHILEDGFALV
jgi:pyruvate dehydrogenase E2 component (dihydrolipoamide acetyltransferase)